jgi:hypothetical protein
MDFQIAVNLHAARSAVSVSIPPGEYTAVQHWLPSCSHKI